MQSVFEPAVFATTFMTLLVIQDPLGAIPIFLSLTSRQSPSERAVSARQATFVSFGVILVFAVATSSSSWASQCPPSRWLAGCSYCW